MAKQVLACFGVFLGGINFMQPLAFAGDSIKHLQAPKPEVVVSLEDFESRYKELR